MDCGTTSQFTDSGYSSSKYTPVISSNSGVPLNPSIVTTGHENSGRDKHTVKSNNATGASNHGTTRFDRRSTNNDHASAVDVSSDSTRDSNGTYAMGPIKV